MSAPQPNPADRINLIDLPAVPPASSTEQAQNAAIAAIADALGRFAQPPYGDLQCSTGRAAVVAVRAAAPILLAAGRKQAADREQTLINALADCVVKSTEYGIQDGGFVANYITPTGPIHRAIPLLQELGITVRPGFDGRIAEGGEPNAG